MAIKDHRKRMIIDYYSSDDNENEIPFVEFSNETFRLINTESIGRLSMNCHIPELNGIFLLVNLTFFLYSLYCHSIAFDSLKVFIIQDPAKGTTSFFELFAISFCLLPEWR